MNTAEIVAEFMKGCSCGPPGECEPCLTGFVSAVIAQEKRMAGPSNLPPGCSSPDGGIDHEFEQALEAFTDFADTPEAVKIINAVGPAILLAVHDAYSKGFRDGGESALDSLDAALEKAVKK